ncbi:MAG: hypothetical protein ABI183_09635 [Polyangiaceae bacterium]
MKIAAYAALGLFGALPSSASQIKSANRAANASSPLHAQVVCERAGVVGRVRCDVEAQVDGARITWGDAQILDCPPFAFPLKGRIGPDDAAVRTPERWRWAFGLVAKDVGSGSISVRVRAVVCVGDACSATSVTVAAPLVVGS